ncbi:MAG TPA: hypothetical protein VKF62_10995, partial [Planctomycetota bacterium]|nr:hypothetical protein [Planctomycetota bacterium]
MNRTLLGSLLLLAAPPAALAQSTACVAGTPVSSYWVCPFASGFTSILSDPGTQSVGFGSCADNSQTNPNGISIPFAFS